MVSPLASPRSVGEVRLLRQSSSVPQLGAVISSAAASQAAISPLSPPPLSQQRTCSPLQGSRQVSAAWPKPWQTTPHTRQISAPGSTVSPVLPPRASRLTTQPISPRAPMRSTPSDHPRGFSVAFPVGPPVSSVSVPLGIATTSQQHPLSSSLPVLSPVAISVPLGAAATSQPQVSVAAPCATSGQMLRPTVTTANAYQADIADPMDAAFASELNALDTEAASRLHIAREQQGQYFVDGRHISLGWGGDDNLELFVREHGIHDIGVETSLQAYLRQAANVNLSLHGKLEGRVPAISRVPKQCRMTFLNAGNSAATLDNVDDSERVRWMKLACEQASLREVSAGGTTRRTYKC